MTANNRTPRSPLAHRDTRKHELPNRHTTKAYNSGVISANLFDVAVLEMGEDEGGAGDVADAAGAGGDVKGAPAAGEQGEPAFAQAAQGAEQRDAGGGIDFEVPPVGGLFAATNVDDLSSPPSAAPPRRSRPRCSPPVPRCGAWPGGGWCPITALPVPFCAGVSESFPPYTSSVLIGLFIFQKAAASSRVFQPGGPITGRVRRTSRPACLPPHRAAGVRSVPARRWRQR
jgi:hypothetical protein